MALIERILSSEDALRYREVARLRRTAICFEDIDERLFYHMTQTQRLVFFLFYDRGLRICEAASLLGKSPKYVRKTLTAAELNYSYAYREVAGRPI